MLLGVWGGLEGLLYRGVESASKQRQANEKERIQSGSIEHPIIATIKIQSCCDLRLLLVGGVVASFELYWWLGLGIERSN
jgi:hypothetical protein